MSMFKIIGDLFGGYVVHIAGAAAAVLIGSEVYQNLVAFAQPVTDALK